MLELIKRYFENEPPTPHKKAALNALAQYVEAKDLDYKNLTTDQIAELFSNFRSSNESVVRRYKAALRDFLVWVGAETSVKSLQSYGYQYKTKSISFNQDVYFGEYASMIQAFEAFADRQEIPDPNKYAAYLTLAWFGFPKERIKDLEFSQVSIGETFEADGFKIRNPKAVDVLTAYRNSAGFTTRAGRFLNYKPSRFYFRGNHGTEIAQRLLTMCRDAGCPGRFTYENVAQSAIYAKAYDGAKMIGIPIVKTPQGTAHRKMILKLLELPETWTIMEFKNRYLPFYEWCKVFRQVDD